MITGIPILGIAAGIVASGFCFQRPQRRRKSRFLAWDIDRAVEALGEKIKEDGFEPDIMVGVGRGGLTVGGMLVGKLRMSSLTFFHTKHEWTSERSGGQAADYPENLDVEDLRVLLVTGAVDAEAILKRAFDHISSKGPKAVRTAAIFKLDTSQFVPDYYIHRIKSPAQIPLWR